MAFQMNYTDNFGETYAASYWKLMQCNVDRFNQSAYLVFIGYKDAASEGKRIIGEKSYFVESADFASYFATSELDPEGKNPYKQAYIFAASKQDAGSGNDAVSFFDGAAEV